jgi:hypothetical protein
LPVVYFAAYFDEGEEIGKGYKGPIKARKVFKGVGLKRAKRLKA